MAEFRWIKASLCLILVLQFTAATGQRYLSFTVRDGDEVTLPCDTGTVTEHKDTEEVTVNCSVSTYLCVHTVKWLIEGQDVDKDHKDLMTSQSYCSASLTFMTFHFFNTSRFNSLICEVTFGDKVQKFPFRNSPSGDKTGEDTTTTTTTTEDDTTSGWWRFIYVPVGLAALIIIVVAVNIWARIKEKKTPRDEIAVRHDEEDETVNYENSRPPDGV
ncbi:uncharacterized protein LOC117727816 isoform X2 [Cyclopterus lumpus]|uniref:uncharacterized protein LOC117727816 isoform X2 n=1 Tax=Cyclopterus lumpus TaxID=8103 RepID=UPI0014873033|nr:uncharacterized protein LOC117727816 isoform X2 [Cyclopterus lumpus]